MDTATLLGGALASNQQAITSSPATQQETAVAAAAAVNTQPVKHRNLFVSILEAVGKGFEKGLKWAVTYAIPAEKLVALIFPSAAPVAAEVVNATALIQKAVITVEQKFAASGKQSGTGTEKLAEVLELTQETVTDLLQKAGVKADTTYITKIVNAVVAILNVQLAEVDLG